jgi:Undecaprenyl-phosphate galactose phosphotransferase WbaP
MVDLTQLQSDSTVQPGLVGIRRLYEIFFKRVLDLVISITILPIILPTILVLCLLVRRDGGAGLFGHARMGKDGKVFSCWKIRTMVPDAQARLDALLASDAEARAEWERDHKLRNDPRVTRLGNFLRRSSLDELPQIWNVLKGEMSLIGPRPVTEPELQRYGKQAPSYLMMRPGITGLWQVSGRNDISYAERVALDVKYLDEMSLWKDLAILYKTVFAVVGRTGR